MHKFDVILRPITTEKTNAEADNGRYTFQVDVRANKLQVKAAVEAAFKVKVMDVNILRVQGKLRRSGRRGQFHQLPEWKKAVVTLAAGNRITLFEGV